jgi:hypothetical protein
MVSVPSSPDIISSIDTAFDLLFALLNSPAVTLAFIFFAMTVVGDLREAFEKNRNPVILPTFVSLMAILITLWFCIILGAEIISSGLAKMDTLCTALVATLLVIPPLAGGLSFRASQRFLTELIHNANHRPLETKPEVERLKHIAPK